MAGEKKLYHNVTVTERPDITPEGKVVKLYQVSARTKKDTYFAITVAEKDFSKENVDKLLIERATLIDSIQEL